eukprot:Platyproteum_vivax@DN2675_c0_g1_i1.p1
MNRKGDFALFPEPLWTKTGAVPPTVKAIWMDDVQDRKTFQKSESGYEWRPVHEVNFPSYGMYAPAPVPATPPSYVVVMAETMAQIPVDTHGNLLSVGSIDHQHGTCKPCVFAHHPTKPCLNGFHCGFCHYSHAPKKRIRGSRKKRFEAASYYM